MLGACEYRLFMARDSAEKAIIHGSYHLMRICILRPDAAQDPASIAILYIVHPQM